MNTTSKRWFVIILSVLIIAAATVVISLQLRKRPIYSYVQVKAGEVVGGVTLNGTVQAAQDIALSFQAGGTITKVNVKVGDVVKAGQQLVALDSKGASASLSQTEAALQAAQANEQKTINGATGAQLPDPPERSE